MFDDMRSMTEYRIGINYLVDKVSESTQYLHCVGLKTNISFFCLKVKKSRVAHLKQQKVNGELTHEIEEMQKQIEVRFFLYFDGDQL